MFGHGHAPPETPVSGSLPSRGLEAPFSNAKDDAGSINDTVMNVFGSHGPQASAPSRRHEHLTTTAPLDLVRERGPTQAPQLGRRVGAPLIKPDISSPAALPSAGPAAPALSKAAAGVVPSSRRDTSVDPPAGAPASPSAPSAPDALAKPDTVTTTTGTTKSAQDPAALRKDAPVQPPQIAHPGAPVPRQNRHASPDWSSRNAVYHGKPHAAERHP
ncbi:hypothetical protein DL96DRAFT_1600844 [Flagelloscypha sp. PMI_526]|nr:hypothetical protein DL96DRAFT_1600844 [Flagelloscypha sp. PMI_526]